MKFETANVCTSKTILGHEYCIKVYERRHAPWMQEWRHAWTKMAVAKRMCVPWQRTGGPTCYDFGNTATCVRRFLSFCRDWDNERACWEGSKERGLSINTGRRLVLCGWSVHHLHAAMWSKGGQELINCYPMCVPEMVRSGVSCEENTEPKIERNSAIDRIMMLLCRHRIHDEPLWPVIHP